MCERSGSLILQPALTAEGDILICGGLEDRMRRIGVAREPDGWKIKERWTSVELKPYFNDFVIHKGHAYGFNGRSLALIHCKNMTSNTLNFYLQFIYLI
jgi:outer membrane protein assembly factor BamB